MPHTLLYILVAATVCVAACSLFLLYRKTEAMRRNNQKLRAVVDSQKNFTFLVDRDFEVQETNYYAYVRPVNEGPRVLGNVLRCKNANVTGRCGEAEACKMCPVRFVINKSFDRRADFDQLEACMEVDGPDGKVVDVDVQLEGRFVSLDNQDHIVVNVRDVTRQNGADRPKILFVSEDVQLFDKVRQSLSQEFRVLDADTPHQALHRMLMASRYQFYAVLTDEDFYNRYDIVTRMLVENTQLSVYVFGSQERGHSEGHVQFLRAGIEGQELLKVLVGKKHVERN